MYVCVCVSVSTKAVDTAAWLTACDSSLSVWYQSKLNDFFHMTGRLIVSLFPPRIQTDVFWWSINKKKQIFQPGGPNLEGSGCKNPACRCKSKLRPDSERIADANWSIRKSLSACTCRHLEADLTKKKEREKIQAHKQTLLVNQSNERWYVFSPPVMSN